MNKFEVRIKKLKGQIDKLLVRTEPKKNEYENKETCLMSLKFTDHTYLYSI